MTKPASLWLKTFGVGFALISALLVWTLFTPAPYGDLTRIGRLSEAQFGWTRPAPEVNATLLHSVPLDQAEVLVVGDSFSMTLYWQSALVKAGYKVATTYWGEIGYMCGDFGEWLRKQGYQGKLVIAQSIERALDERLKRSEACAAMSEFKPLKIRPDPFLGPLTLKPDSGLNWNAKLTAGPITWANTRKAVQVGQPVQLGDQTLVYDVADGCKQFSHAMCERLPIFKEDLDHGPLTAQSFERMQRLSTRHADLHLLWMVIPNKTTVYLTPDFSEGFVQQLRAHPELGPDLYAMTQRERFAIQDLYFGNDTHMSMHGQLAMGALMLEAVKKRLAPSSANGT